MEKISLLLFLTFFSINAMQQSEPIQEKIEKFTCPNFTQYSVEIKHRDISIIIRKYDIKKNKLLGSCYTTKDKTIITQHYTKQQCKKLWKFLKMKFEQQKNQE